MLKLHLLAQVGPEVQVLGSVVACPHRSARDEVVRILSDEAALLAPPESEGSEGSEVKASDLIGVSTEKFQVQIYRHIFPHIHPLISVWCTPQVIIAVRQGNILATAFHPELTTDLRWHRLVHPMPLVLC